MECAWQELTNLSNVNTEQKSTDKIKNSVGHYNCLATEVK